MTDSSDYESLSDRRHSHSSVRTPEKVLDALGLGTEGLLHSPNERLEWSGTGISVATATPSRRPQSSLSRQNRNLGSAGKKRSEHKEELHKKKVSAGKSPITAMTSQEKDQSNSTSRQRRSPVDKKRGSPVAAGDSKRFPSGSNSSLKGGGHAKADPKGSNGSASQSSPSLPDTSQRNHQSPVSLHASRPSVSVDPTDFIRRAQEASAARVELLSDSLTAPSLEATMFDLRGTSGRIAQILRALHEGVPYRPGANASIETYEVLDADLYRIDELQRQITVMSADLESQHDTIRRTEQEMAEKSRIITHLMQYVEELEERIAGGGGGGQTGNKGDGRAPIKSGQVGFMGEGANQDGSPDDVDQDSAEILTPLASQSGFGDHRRSRGSTGVTAVHGMFGTAVSSALRRGSLCRFSVSGCAKGMKSPLHARRKSSRKNAFSDTIDCEVSDLKDQLLYYHLQQLEEPLFIDTAPVRGSVAFLCCAVENLEKIYTFDSASTMKCMTLYLGTLANAVTKHNGYTVQHESELSVFAFHEPISALQCALTLQYDLVSLDWPSILHDQVETMAARDETADTPTDAAPASGPLPPRRRSFRRYSASSKNGDWLWRGLRVKMSVFQPESFQCARDLCTRKVQYFGKAIKTALYYLRKAEGGMITVDTSLKDLIANHLILLNDPSVTFYEWIMFPGNIERPFALYSVCHCEQAARKNDFVIVQNRRLTPQAFALLTDPEKEPSLDNEAVAKFLVPVPEFVDEVPGGLNSGDYCFVFIHLPRYEEIEAKCEEAHIINYLRRYHRLVQETRPPSVPHRLVSVHRDRYLLSFQDPLDAVRFAQDLQQRTVKISWPDPFELLEFVRPQYFARRLVFNGPTISITIHQCKAKAVKSVFPVTNGMNENCFFSSQELPNLLAMSSAISDYSSIVVSEVVYSYALFALKELGYPVILPCGLFDASTGNNNNIPASSPLFQLIPRDLVGRIFVSVDLGDAVKRPYKGILKSCVREYILQYEYLVRHKLMLPSTASLSHSDLIGNPGHQANLTRIHFERSKIIRSIEAHLSQLIEQYQRVRTGSRRELMEGVEGVLMMVHDDLVPPTLPENVLRVPTTLLQEMFKTSSSSARRPGEPTPAVNSLTPQTASLTPRGVAAAGSSSTPRRSSQMELEGAKASEETVRALEVSVNRARELEQSFRTAEAHFEEERRFFRQQGQQTVQSVLFAHKLVQFYFAALRQYLLPLVDDNTAILGDDDFIIQWIQVFKTIREKQSRTLSSENKGKESKGASQLRTKIGDQWKELVGHAVELDDDDFSDYDPTRLCNSILGHCARSFLFLRTVRKRVGRQLDKVSRERSKEATSSSRVTRIAQEARARDAQEKATPKPLDIDALKS